MKKVIAVLLLFTLNLIPCSAQENYLYYVQSFDNEQTRYNGYTAVPKTDEVTGMVNTAEVVTDSDTNNSYFKLNKTFAGNDCHVDFTMGKTENNIVIDTNIRVDSFGAEAQLFFMRDSISTISNLDAVAVNLLAGGVLKIGSKSVQITTKKWYNLTAAFDIQNKTCSVYLDNVLIEQNYTYTAKNITQFTMLRFRMQGDGIGDLQIDNIKIYNGTEKRDTSGDTLSPMLSPVFKANTYSMALLSGKQALHGYSGNMFINGEKTKAEVMPVNIGDEIYVSVSDMKRLINKEITVDGVYIYIDDIKFRLELSAAEKGSVFLQLDYAPKMINGAVMLPVESVAETVGQYAYNDKRGLIILSQAEISLNSSQLVEINGYLFHERPSEEKITELFNQNNTPHPRLLITGSEFEQIRIQSDQTISEWRDNAIIKAQALLSTEPNHYEIPDGLRLLSVSTSVVSRVMTLGFAYQMTYDDIYAERAWSEIEAVCNFPDWNAHAHFLDAAEMSFAVGLGYDWMYNYWTAEQKSIMVTALKNFGLGEAKKVYYRQYDGGSNFWATTNINWNSVCNGGIGAAAFAIMEEDTGYCSNIIANAIRGLEYAWYEIAPDGAWDEGVGYWGYFLNYAVRFFSTIENSLGTDFNFFNFKAVNKIGYFQAQLSSPLGNNNFHDASQSHGSIASMHYLSNKFNNPDFSALRMLYLNQYNQSNSIEDILWYHPGNTQLSQNMPTDVYYRNVEAVTMRQNWFDSGGMFTSFHGGKTTGGHNHFDTGAFVYEVMGERWAIDLGAEDYNLASVYGKENLYRVRAEGHNTLVMNPSLKPGQDADGFAPVTKTEFGDGESFGVLDMSSNYKNYANNVTRSFYAGDNKRSLSIRDEMNLKEETTVYWFMHTKASVIKTGSRQMLLTQNGKKLNFVFDTNAQNVTLETMNAAGLTTSPVVEEQNQNAGILKIVIKIVASGNVNLNIKLSPYGENIDAVASDTPISGLTVKTKRDDFSNGTENGIFGRSNGDISMNAQNLTVKTNCRKINNSESVKLSCYAAFPSSAEDNVIKSFVTLNGYQKSETPVDFLTFTRDGIIKLFGKELIPKGSSFIKNKWYKIDLILTAGEYGVKSSTATLYIDNALIVQNVDILSGGKPDYIDAFLFNSMYIDDFSFGICYEDMVTNITLIHSQWNYNKFLNTKKGIFTFEQDEFNTETLKNLGMAGIKSSAIIEKDKKYLVLTTVENEKLYAPILAIGEKAYESESYTQGISFENQPLAYLPFTIRFNISAQSGCRASVKIAGNYYDFLTMNADGYIYIGGVKTSVTWSEDDLIESAVTIYSGKKEWDVYINGKAVMQKQAVFSQNVEFVSEFMVNGAQVSDILCHSGGYYNNIDIGELYLTDSEICSASINAQSLKTLNGCLILAFYKDNKLIKITSNDINITADDNKFEIFGQEQDATVIKAMMIQNFLSMKPLVYSKTIRR